MAVTWPQIINNDDKLVVIGHTIKRYPIYYIHVVCQSHVVFAMIICKLRAVVLAVVH